MLGNTHDGTAAGAPRTGGSGPEPRRRIGAKLLVTDGRRAFLVREERSDGSTFWTLPGGGVDPGESLAGGLRREIREELGCECAFDGPVTTCRYRHTSRPDTETRYVVFTGRLTTPPDPNPTEGVTGCAWLSPGAFPASLLDPFRRVLAEVFPGPKRPSPSVRSRSLGR